MPAPAGMGELGLNPLSDPSPELNLMAVRAAPGQAMLNLSCSVVAVPLAAVLEYLMLAGNPLAE